MLKNSSGRREWGPTVVVVKGKPLSLTVVSQCEERLDNLCVCIYAVSKIQITYPSLPISRTDMSPSKRSTKRP